MTQSTSGMNTNKFFSGDFMKTLMPAGTMMPFDMGSLIDMQRKNMQAMTEAQQVTMESMQASGQHLAEMISRMMQNNTEIAQQMMSDGTPEEKMARQADMMKKAVESTMESLSELSDMISETGKETSEILGKRVTASLTEFKSTVQKKSPKEKAAA